MKKKIFAFMLSAILTLSFFSSTNVFAASEDEGIILYEYSQEELNDMVFTMEMFNSTYTREDVAQLIRLEKASAAPLTNQFVRYTVSDEEIDEFYEEVEEIARRAPALNYYFSRVYWQMRNGMVTLTLTPTDVVKNDPDQNHRTASWSLLLEECGDSQYWTNTSSMSGQFGDWDLEPSRPSTNYFDMLINRCNP